MNKLQKILFGIIIFILFTISGLLCACFKKTSNEERIIGIENKYRTEINIYWSTYEIKTYTYYTDNSVDVCSFNGTNYLIEKGNTEELLSTTAPIEIIKQSKFDKDGKETECETNYYRGSK